MISLVTSALALLVGAGAGGMVGRRAVSDLMAPGRQQIARWSAVVLAGLAGALLASSLFRLVRELDDIGSGGSEPGLAGLQTRFDTLTVAEAFTNILFHGGVLVALATIVALAGKRAARAQRP